MQTFAPKLMLAGQPAGNNLRQLKQPLQSQGAPGGELGVAQHEMLRALHNSLQAKSTAQHRHLFNHSPRVESVASYQRSANSSPTAVTQAKFQNILNNRQDVSQVAQLKSDASISGAVVQRNGDSDEPSWKDKLRAKAPWLGLGAYFAGTRAAAKYAAKNEHWRDSLKNFGKEQIPEFGDFFKPLHLWKYAQQIRRGGYQRYLAAAPLLAGGAYLGLKYLPKLSSSSKKEEES